MTIPNNIEHNILRKFEHEPNHLLLQWRHTLSTLKKSKKERV